MAISEQHSSIVYQIYDTDEEEEEEEEECNNDSDSDYDPGDSDDGDRDDDVLEDAHSKFSELSIKKAARSRLVFSFELSGPAVLNGLQLTFHVADWELQSRKKC